MTKFLHYINLLIAAVLMSGLAACGDTDDDDPVLKEDLVLTSCSIQSGATVDALRTSVIVLDYSPKSVQVAAGQSATLNGNPVKVNRGSSLTTVEIAVELENNQDYHLVVPAGTIVGLSDPSRTAPQFTLDFNTHKPVVEETEISAATMVQALGFGWNLGNHFDSFDGNNAANNYRITWSSTPYWDGVRPKQELYASLAENGIKTVRICVTWGPYQDMTNGKFTIADSYMSEVKQNVDWALKAGLNVLVNTHHDEYWQDIISATKDTQLNTQIKARITATWTQIAEYYKDYGQKLLFETFNELHDDAWGWANGYDYSPVFKLMDEWNQVAVDAIRSTGGNNAARWIGIPGFCASPTFTDGDKNLIKIPNDPANHIMVAVHTYDPFNFCTEGTVQRWGHTYRNNDNEENAVKNLFAKMKKQFIDKGIPCYFGEFGCESRLKPEDEPFRTYYMEYLCRTAYFAGIPVMLWDNDNNNQGADGSGECFWYVNHENGNLHTPALIRTMVKAATSTDANYTIQSIYDNAPAN